MTQLDQVPTTNVNIKELSQPINQAVSHHWKQRDKYKSLSARHAPNTVHPCFWCKSSQHIEVTGMVQLRNRVPVPRVHMWTCTTDQMQYKVSDRRGKHQNQSTGGTGSRTRRTPKPKALPNFATEYLWHESQTSKGVKHATASKQAVYAFRRVCVRSLGWSKGRKPT